MSIFSSPPYQQFTGFNRIVVDKNGQAAPPSEAHRRNVKPTVGFKRQDGWCLGAPAEFETEALRMWATEWTHFVRIPDRIDPKNLPCWLPIAHYDGKATI